MWTQASETQLRISLREPVDETASGVKMKASELVMERCPIETARTLTMKWHSRLPHTQKAPWVLAFAARTGTKIYAVALWNNPSARNLSRTWLELRRMAVSDEAPHCTASWFLAAMTKWIKRYMPGVERLISYQDTSVHKGTIYKAAGWVPGAVAKARLRDRSKSRIGTNRAYRKNTNGLAVDGAEKIRWELKIHTSGV